VTWAPDYITSAQLKNYLGIQNNADDAFIALWITTVSRNVDDFCGRQFGQTAAAEDRFYTPVYDRPAGKWIANIDDVQDVTGLSVEDEDGTAIAPHTSTVDGYLLLPRNAAAKGRPYEQLQLDSATGDIAVNVKFGWSAQPAAVSTGMFLQASRLNSRRRSPFGIAGSPTEGSEIRLLAQLDPDFRTSLKPLVREWWAA
jgi:hypothetical protein